MSNENSQWQSRSCDVHGTAPGRRQPMCTGVRKDDYACKLQCLQLELEVMRRKARFPPARHPLAQLASTLAWSLSQPLWRL